MSDLLAPVDIDFELDAAEAASAMRQHVMRQTSFRFRAALGVAAAAMIGWSVAGGPWAWWVGVAAGVGVLGALAMLVMWLFPLISVSRNPQLTQAYHFRFTPRGLDFHTDESEGHLGWERYQEALQTDEFYLLYYEKEHFSVVPRRALTDEQEERLQGLIAKYVVKEEGE